MRAPGLAQAPPYVRFVLRIFKENDSLIKVSATDLSGDCSFVWKFVEGLCFQYPQLVPFKKEDQKEASSRSKSIKFTHTQMSKLDDKVES
jgi:hypothetical protein